MTRLKFVATRIPCVVLYYFNMAVVSHFYHAQLKYMDSEEKSPNAYTRMLSIQRLFYAKIYRYNYIINYIDSTGCPEKNGTL